MAMGEGGVGDGGPAFPTVDANRDADYGTRGMALRDYFAGKAIQPFMIWALDRRQFDDYDTAAKAAAAYAQSAYLIADALLTARGRS